MPIVTLELVVNQPTDVQTEATQVQRLSDELGKLFGSDPGGTWVRLRYLPRARYAENNEVLDGDVQPTFVDVLKRTMDSHVERSAEAAGIAAIVADVLQRPKANVHVIYAAAGAGRVAFGGQLLEPTTRQQ